MTSIDIAVVDGKRIETRESKVWEYQGSTYKVAPHRVYDLLFDSDGKGFDDTCYVIDDEIAAYVPDDIFDSVSDFELEIYVNYAYYDASLDEVKKRYQANKLEFKDESGSYLLKCNFDTETKEPYVELYRKTDDVSQDEVGGYEWLKDFEYVDLTVDNAISLLNRLKGL